MNVRTRYKVLIWLALAFTGFWIAAAAGPIYASYYWPKELLPTSETMSSGDIEAMISAAEKAKPIAATANQLTALGKLLTAVSIIGLSYTVFMHFRERNGISKQQADEEPQIVQNAG